MFAYEPHPEELYQVFQMVAVEREQQALGQLSDELEQLPSLTRSSYPRSAAEAAQDPQRGAPGTGAAAGGAYGSDPGLDDGMGR